MLRELYLGFAKVHILYHASQEPVYGLWLIGELSRHGYNLGPGTVYPMLHDLERKGLLRCEKRVVNGRWRKYYALTPQGEESLAGARHKIRELVTEVL